MMNAPTDQSWRDSANCRTVDPELFFPAASHAGVGAARAICRRCDVFTECLRDALDTPPGWDRDGIRAGTGPRERMKLRKQLGLVAA